MTSPHPSETKKVRPDAHVDEDGFGRRKVRYVQLEEEASWRRKKLAAQMRQLLKDNTVKVVPASAEELESLLERTKQWIAKQK